MMMLLVLGLLVFAIGVLMLLIAAFSVSIWWGIFCIFFPPTYVLFVLLNWGKSWRPLLVQVMGMAIIIAAGLMIDGFFSTLREYSFSPHQTHRGVITTAAPAVAAVPGIHQCIDQKGNVIYSNQDCLQSESTDVSLKTMGKLPVLPDAVKPVEESPQTSQNQYHCDGRTRCSQMTSCDEATYFLQHCPGTVMDGDGDGVPCEGQWCH